MGTLAVAVAAAIFAWFQVREVRRTREEKARPHVAVYFESNGRLLFLVVKNFGTTTARDVRLLLDKPIKQSFKVEAECVTLPLSASRARRGSGGDATPGRLHDGAWIPVFTGAACQNRTDDVLITRWAAG